MLFLIGPVTSLIPGPVECGFSSPLSITLNVKPQEHSGCRRKIQTSAWIILQSTDAGVYVRCPRVQNFSVIISYEPSLLLLYLLFYLIILNYKIAL